MFVLVVTRRAATGELVRQTLGAEGWWVTAVADRETAVRSASGQAPQLVVVDGRLPEAGELVRDFAARRGGPGVLLLAAGEETAGGEAAAGADAVLAADADADTLAAAVRRLLEETSEPAADGLPTPGQVLNAQDIFGDMLLEIGTDSPLAEPPAPPAPVTVSLSAPPEEETGGAPPAPPPLDTRPLALAGGLEAAGETAGDPDRAASPALREPDPAILGAIAAGLENEASAARSEAAEAVEAVEATAPAEADAVAAVDEPGPRPPEPSAPPQEPAAAGPAARGDEPVLPAADEPAEDGEAKDGEAAPVAAAASATGYVWWSRRSLPGGGRFWLGLVAGLLVFAGASLMLERIFPPAPTAVAAPAVDEVALQELVERELAEREAALREALLEEERRLQDELEEAEDPSS